jgi:hypothetical protein
VAATVQRYLVVLVLAIGVVFMAGCSGNDPRSAAGASGPVKIAFLHHSTGEVVWVGSTSKVSSKVFGNSDVKKWIADYNKANKTKYEIGDITFPTGKDYAWANYPYDYYNIWVKNAGDVPYRGEPTLEMLTKKYDVIVWKHCYPVGAILPDTGKADVGSEEKRLENYKLQYLALRDKMRSYPDKQFVVWTGAAQVKGATSPEEARRTREFFDWVKSEWDEPGDNIFLWDFYELETEGGAFMKQEYAKGETDSHPNPDFGARVAPLFAQRVVNVIEGRGDSTPLTGK